MNDPFIHIRSHARAMMIEQIMALIGRASSDPKQYRRTLESFEDSTLRRTLEQITLGDCANENFPALGLTENAGEIASTDKGHAPDSSRELNFELVTMTWHCVDCHSNFQGPTNSAPKNGCAYCGSQNVFDVNVEQIGGNKFELP